MDNTNQLKQKNDAKYTAVVYFHGMGNQRRYEEVSRWVDALDRHAHKNKKSKGFLAGIKAFLEPHWREKDKNKGYIRVKHIKNDAINRVCHFHEIYWAPIPAGETTAVSVLKWIFSQVLTPIKILVSPWRLRHRIHRSALYALQDFLKMCSWTRYEKEKDEDFKSLLKTYHFFEGSSSYRKFSNGSFIDFLKFITENSPFSDNKKKRLHRLAWQWYIYSVFTEIKNIFVVFSLLLYILLALLSMGVLISMILEFIAGIGIQSFLEGTFLSGLSTYFEPTFENIMSGIILLATATGLTFFLREYLGDVQIWTTYEETQEKHRKRKEILELGVDKLKHLLKDKLCERIVIVSHSLGTTIAFDSLLELGRMNRARLQKNLTSNIFELEKIDHFITMGSPIDKVYYFFESHYGKCHRYNRVVEQMRGDMGYIPFAKKSNSDKKNSFSIPLIHWVNFWDTADIVSGSLQSPNSGFDMNLRVDNIHVRNCILPNPGKSHSDYLENDNVLAKIFDMIFEKKYSFKNVTSKYSGNEDYEAIFMGPGKKTRWVPLVQLLTLLIPWFIAFSIIM